MDPAEPARRHAASISCRSLMEAADVEMQVIDNMPPVAAPRALTRIENDGLEVNIPEAAIVLAPDRRVPLQGGRFTAVDIMSDVARRRDRVHLADGARLGARAARALAADHPRGGGPAARGHRGQGRREVQGQPAAARRPADERHQGGRQGAHHRRPRQEVPRPLRGAGRQPRPRRHRRRPPTPTARCWSTACSPS